MKIFFVGFLFVIAGGAMNGVVAQELPSCNPVASDVLLGKVGGGVEDPRQAHILTRLNTLQADVATAQRGRQISTSQAEELAKRGDAIRQEVAGYVKQQGFLSAAERASYDRELDAMAGKLCGNHLHKKQ